MTGAAALRFLKRRLGLEDMPQDTSWQEPELFDFINAGVEKVVQAFALLPDPRPVKETFALEVDGSDDRLYSFPTAKNDPYRVIEVREKDTRVPLTPGVNENDDGHYVWNSIRELRLADGIDLTGGVEVVAVLFPDAIDEDTASNGWSIPQTTHRAAVYYAEFLALSANDEQAGEAGLQLFGGELDKLERVYGEFDAADGLALREVLLGNYGRWQGDNIY